MANTILAIDEQDKDLGEFCQRCLSDIEVVLEQKGIAPKVLKSAALNDLSVQITTSNFDNFIFAAYSHGTKSCLVGANTEYVSKTVNHTSFANSFFYTFSCSCGTELGQHLIDNNCLCFIGYNRIIGIWTTYIPQFVDCANHGLKLFLEGHSTAQIVPLMKEKYNDEIDGIYPTNYLIASVFRENRDALVMYGKDITLADVT